tara:strand:- start:18 stop:440 length:423 start_codon:yes stop_codon:yes gene_type:complete
MEIVEKDRKILAILKENARASIRDIAKKTSLRPSTVHHRIQRLDKEGVIEKFTVKLNNDAVGENFIVFILVKTNKNLEGKLLHDQRIKEVFGVTGGFDLMIKCKFKDIIDFNDFIIKFRKQDGIGATETLVSTLTLKEEL